MHIPFFTVSRSYHILYIAISICLLGSFLSCGVSTPANETANTTADTAITITTDTNAQQKEAVYTDDSDDDELQFLPKDISSSSIGAVRTLHGKTFDPVAALKALLPGTYYSFPDRDSTITERLVSWKCRDCKEIQIKGWYEETTDPFPNAEGNMTMYTDTLLFTDDDGRQNVLLVLSTVPVQSREFMYTGRFSCATLGLAWFMAVGNEWQLKSFSPAIGCYGAFQRMPDMHLVKLGKNNYGCYLLNTNGGAGGPYYSDLYVFGIVNGELRKIMEDAGVERIYDGISEWTSVVSSAKAPENNFEHLGITIKGTYNKKSFTTEDTVSNLPKELLSYIKTKDSLNFTITREYHFAQGNYSNSASRVDLK